MDDISYECPYCKLTVRVPYMLPLGWDKGYGQEEFPLTNTVECPNCKYPYELTITYPCWVLKRLEATR